MKKFILVLVSNMLALTTLHANQTAERPPTPVLAIKTHHQSWAQEVEATGTLEAQKGLTLKTEVAGRVSEVFFQSGQVVEAGQILIQLNPDILRAQLERYKAEYLLAQSNYNRYLKLYAQKTITKSELDKSQAARDSAKANLDQTQAQLSQVTIRAPFKGQVGLTKITPGTFIGIGQDIVNLQQNDQMHVDFNLPEIFLGQLHIGDEVTIKTRAFPSYKIKGKVIALDSEVNRTTRTIATRAEIPNPDHLLIPGMFVEVTAHLGKKTPMLVIPQIAVGYNAKQNYVYKVVDNKAVRTVVTLGERRGDEVAVITGLKADDLIITEGQLKIGDGSPIRVISQ